MSNPLFDVYGQLVDQLFSPGSREGDPVSVCVKTGDAALRERDQALSEADYETIVQHVSPVKLQEIQNAADTLRRLLYQEGGSRSGAITQQLREFRAVLKTGDESRLEGNPFYALVKAVYRLNLDAASRLLQFMHSQSSLHPPKPVAFVPTLREIWGRGNRKAGFLSKVSATIDKWLNSGKLPIEIFVFFGSTYTTARGVSDLLQIPGALPFMAEGFGSSEAELQRTVIAYTCGLLLSCGILDYKGRLFRCVAEAGAFFRGIGQAFKRYPRWMIIATILTLISIKTNYDGIVSLVSKKADLDQQSYEIKQKVRKALGNRRDAKANNPSNLYDLQLILQEAAGVATQKFLQIPKDEAGGGASSGNVGQGPRYWGKFYVIMGGYDPGVADISRAVSNSAMAQTLDKLMRESGLDLKSSMPDKINVLRAEYEQHLKITTDLAESKLAKLDALMSMQDFSWSELNRVFNLEHYEVNAIVAEITRALEANTVKYKEIASRMNTLTEAHVELLKTLDRTGIVGESNYQIDAKAPIPNIDAIDELKKNKIPVATHKSFEELKAFLNDSYGVALASSLLLVIFFIAISMDMANPMLYSRLTAIQGRKDRKAYYERIKKLKEWENDFSVRCKAFFDREDVELILYGATFPNDAIMRNTFSLMLEEVDPWVKDHAHYTFKERSIAWFKSLFETTRIIDIEGYNARAQAVHCLLAQRERFFAQFINRLFPGVMDQELLETGTFAEMIDHVEKESDGLRERLSLEMKQVLLIANRPSMDKRIQEWLTSRRRESPVVVPVESKGRQSGGWSGWFRKRSGNSSLDRLTARLEDAQRAEQEALALQQADELALRMIMNKTGSESSADDEETPLELVQEEAPITWMRVFWYILLQKAAMEPVPFFGYTRLTWLREIEARNRQFGEGLETLYDFIPTLKVTLGETLPRIQDETFDPLMDIWNRFPAHCLASGIEGVEEMEQKFMEMEKTTLEIWGVSQFLGPDLDEHVLAAVTNKDEIDEMARIITGDGGESLFVEKLKTLDKDMQSALKRAKAVEADAIAQMRGVFESVAASRNEINQTLLKINLRGLEMRSMPLPPQSQLRSLARTRMAIEDAPRMASSILARIEAILDVRTTFDEKKFEELRVLEKESREILHHVRQVMRSLESPGLVESAVGQDRAESGQGVDLAVRSGLVKANRAQKTRRKAERQEHESRVMFTSHAGGHYEGMTRDVSMTGIKMVVTAVVQGVAAGEEGMLRLAWDGGRETFPCQVIHAGEHELRLQLLAGQERFLAMMREELLAELAGQEHEFSSVQVDEPHVPDLEPESALDVSWTKVLARQVSRLPRQPSPLEVEPVNRSPVVVESVVEPRELDGQEAVHGTVVEASPSARPRLLAWGPDTLPAEAMDGMEQADGVVDGESTSSTVRLLDWGAHLSASAMDDAVGRGVDGASFSGQATVVAPVQASRLATVADKTPWVERHGEAEAASSAPSKAWLSVERESDQVMSGVEVTLSSRMARVEPSPQPVWVDGQRVVGEMQVRLDEAEQLLLRINMRVLELRHDDAVGVDLLQALEDSGELLDQAPDEIDDLLLRLRAMPEGDVIADSVAYHDLMSLQTATNALLQRMVACQMALGMGLPVLPPIAEPVARPVVKAVQVAKRGVVKLPVPVFSPSAGSSSPLESVPLLKSIPLLENPPLLESDMSGKEVRQQPPAPLSSMALFQTLRDDNVQLRRDWQPFQTTMTRSRVSVVLLPLLIGLVHVHVI